MKNLRKLQVLCLLLAGILLLGGCGSSKTADFRVGALKGPTTIGLLQLMEKAENNETENTYTFTMAVGADELTPLLVQGELDMVLVPANVAAILYNKTQGGICVVDINTLGVLYIVSGSEAINSFEDLRGKTIYLTGKGTTPDLALQYLLSANGIDLSEVSLEYRSEATEIAALLAENPENIAVLPQPFVTVACAQNEQLAIRISMTEEWERVQGDGGSRLVTGVTVVRKEFLEENPEAVKLFLTEHAESTRYTETNLDETAALCVKAEIIANENVAKKAIPYCNITCMTGEEMKEALSGYLGVLYEMNPESVGGSLPEDDFYYLGK
ncbi:MAG: ABC transporter substrate-binding protein [Lachnospiraceae bacterium]|nr:ABC transporter substrate-binding protein [Lachnospiraceae bacterium]